MKNDDTPMWDDPNESAFVRELLQSGRRTQVDYNVERGLSEHLARISAGAGVPTWAESSAAVAKSAAPSWLGYVILPLAAAGIASLTWMVSTSEPATPTPFRRDSAPTEQTSHVTPTPVTAPSTVSPAEDRAAEPSRPASARERAARTGDTTSRELRQGQPARAASPDNATRAQRASGNPVRIVRSGGAEPQAPSAALPPTSSQRSASTASGDTRPSDAHAAAVRPAGVVAKAEPRAKPPVAAARTVEPANERKEPIAAAKPQPAAAPVVDEAQLEREMQMLAVTQRVLDSDPSRALRLAEQGEREFPRTMFSAERRQLALLAMVKLGRLEEARRIGQPFLAQYPKAPWSERLRRALASGQVD